MDFNKHYFPLESNPEVFTDLLERLGTAADLEFQDVLSLDDPTLLPPSTLALVLILPTSESFELKKTLEDTHVPDHTGRMGRSEICWFKQTINNACGLYAILHGICNTEAASMLRSDSILRILLDECDAKDPTQCARILEASDSIEDAYNLASARSQSVAPQSAEEEVDLHYICFVQHGQRLIELDGDRKGPIDRGSSAPGMLRHDALKAIREYVEAEAGDLRFNVMALVRLTSRCS
ncbi:hypothetical protein BST61_g11311 [Cercospora zeina]